MTTIYGEDDLTIHIENDHIIKVLFPLGSEDEKTEVVFDYSNLKDCLRGVTSSCVFYLRNPHKDKGKEKQGEIFPYEVDIGINGGPEEYTMTTFNIIQLLASFSQKETSLIETAIAYLFSKEREGSLFDNYE